MGTFRACAPLKIVPTLCGCFVRLEYILNHAEVFFFFFIPRSAKFLILTQGKGHSSARFNGSIIDQVLHIRHGLNHGPSVVWTSLLKHLSLPLRGSAWLDLAPMGLWETLGNIWKRVWVCFCGGYTFVCAWLWKAGKRSHNDVHIFIEVIHSCITM